jgi:hypothetical protein
VIYEVVKMQADEKLIEMWEVALLPIKMKDTVAGCSGRCM